MKEKNCKKEIYSQIIEVAHQLFIEHGIKDVKMDDIATKLSISKRTIYELFNDKEQLLREVLKFQNEKMHERGKEIIRSSFRPKVYEPSRAAQEWQERYSAFAENM